MSDPNQPALESELSLKASIEALLFVAPDAVSSGHIARVLEQTPRAVENALDELEAEYAERGLQIQRHDKQVRLTTAPQAAALIEHFLGLEASTPLSRAALETLAIVAYQQPVTRPQINAIRGVNSDSVMKSLLLKGIIEDAGRAEGPGRPILYSTTSEFLSHFGLSSTAELPPLNIDDIIQADHSDDDTNILKE
ncbi:MAG: SMC-Scp complex subunit ScpB [Anaerolineae bacterium]|nr:SMC-Scp complex subunit ScpB [Anaerolineae bacterium]MBL6966697.1 SMC-Scp complex subunit ScpB [Anaerolineales bacterium]